MSKVAVPTRDGQIDEHFGHCEAFAIFTLGEDKKILDESLFSPPPGCGCKSGVIVNLLQMGVDTVIGGNMGQGAVQNMRMQGLTVVRGASGAARAAVEAWLAGSLRDSEVLCASHNCLHPH